jgi:hypothetical protein
MAYIGTQPAFGTFKKIDSITTFNGALTTFALTSGGAATTPGTAQNLIVSINGVVQEPGVAYSVSGSNIVFTAAPITGAAFFAVQLGSVGSVAAVPDGSVGNAQISANAITADKIASGAVGNTQIAAGAVGNTQLASGAALANLGFTPVSAGKSIALSMIFGG